MGWNVFVTGLPQEATSEEVKDFFEPFGKVQCVRIVPISRRPAIVEFSSQREGQNAINNCHERSFRKDQGTPLHVSWAFVQPPPNMGYFFF
jgi:RNA recognition motif-containing protein